MVVKEIVSFFLDFSPVLTLMEGSGKLTRMEGGKAGGGETKGKFGGVLRPTMKESEDMLRRVRVTGHIEATPSDIQRESKRLGVPACSPEFAFKE